MPPIRLTVTDERWRFAIERAAAEGVLPTASMIFAMDDGEVQRIATRITELALANELAWLDERGIAYTVCAADDTRSLDLLIVGEAAAQQFLDAWGGELLNMKPGAGPSGSQH